jgi:hypothetical protein
MRARPGEGGEGEAVGDGGLWSKLEAEGRSLFAFETVLL